MIGACSRLQRCSLARMLTNSTTVVITLLLALAVAASAWAERMDKGAPIQIYARTIEIDQRTGIAVYRGDVTMTDGTITLKADTVRVYTQNGQIEVFKAFGKPVDVESRDPVTHQVTRAKAERAIYYASTQKLDMFDNVQLFKQDSELRCAELHYDMLSQQFLAKGDGSDRGRCYVLFQPQSKTAGTSAPETRAK
jgi:lipopolysaccharide export system protein LptA